ncbi:protein of unknown function [Actinopolyspora alba]|uniref:DUF397 domain-containing protein n=1 Tax=Actinopolyspora alba TaxID=673379 RepID=A0A1I1ZMQ5_9ACTN|nr:DUF397 domain-containing protein [Actinopolyspora alba]SFE33094.1 protein of unknown function [Actinopolyspora alba]
METAVHGVIAGWRTSTYSQNNAACVEVGSAPGVVGVRDSKLGPDSPVLAMRLSAWSAFAVALREGRFDH